MDNAFNWNDRYAGDDAWTEWFQICSVCGCSPSSSAALAAEIESAMYSNLARHGISRDDAQGEDPVAFFDSYFKLRGSRDAKKPLKSYYAYRIVTEGRPMKDFICGTLFGSASGRIRDIVLEWIAALKGWRLRTAADGDGRRKAAWENAGFDEEAAPEVADVRDPTEFLDESEYRKAAERALARTAAKIHAEKASVALCLYVTAMDIPVTEPAVLAALGLAKSRAYVVVQRTIEAFEKIVSGVEGADAPLFARILIDACVSTMKPELRQQLGAEA